MRLLDRKLVVLEQPGHKLVVKIRKGTHTQANHADPAKQCPTKRNRIVLKTNHRIHETDLTVAYALETK
jgi:hypothetical protein